MLRFLTILLPLLLAACSPSSGEPMIEVTDAWARPTSGAGQVSAAYLIVRNEGTAEDRLIGASSEAARQVTVHSSSNEVGIARMRRLENGLAIPPGASVKLKPGGNHMMLEGLKAPLAVGESIRIALRFERSGEKIVTVPIGNGPAGASAHDH